MATRVITGLVTALYLFAVLAFRGWLMVLTLIGLTVLSLTEIFAAMRLGGFRPVCWVPICMGITIVPLTLLSRLEWVLPFLILALLLIAFCICLRKEPRFIDLLASVFTLLYPVMPMLLLTILAYIKPVEVSTLAFWLSVTIAAISDTFAFFIGSYISKFSWKHPLCPNISPKKTIEGAAAGLIASTLYGAVCGYLSAMWLGTSITWWHFPIIGLLGGAATIVGDLTASMLKRHSGIKDFGSFFPGHGGIVDRLDGVFFCIAIVYVYFAIFLGHFM